MKKAMNKAYNKYDRAGIRTQLTEDPEHKFSEIYKQIAELDGDLAFELDNIVGELARAYEKQGFEAGYNANYDTGCKEAAV